MAALGGAGRPARVCMCMCVCVLFYSRLLSLPGRSLSANKDAATQSEREEKEEDEENEKDEDKQ